MGCGGNIFAKDISQNIMQTAEDKDEVSHHSMSATSRESDTLQRSYDFAPNYLTHTLCVVVQNDTLNSLKRVHKKAYQT